jgi:hypothetical protein
MGENVTCLGLWDFRRHVIGDSNHL